jgi:hypothetical protein
MEPFGEANGLESLDRLADDGKIRLVIEDRAQTLAHDIVIVR